MGVFWDPPRLDLVSQVLFRGPQLVRVFKRLLSVLMPCLLSVRLPGWLYFSVACVAFTFLYCLGAAGLCYVGVRPVTLSGVRPFHSPLRKLLGPSSEYGRLRSG